MVKNFFNHIIIILHEFFFPKVCFGCNQVGTYFCHRCKKNVKSLYQLCPICEKPSLTGATHPKCVLEKDVSGVYSCFPYHSDVGKMLKSFKYEGVRELRFVLAGMVSNQLKKTSLLDFWRNKEFIFLPVPIHPLKKLIRGFNQSALILKLVCRDLGLSYSEDYLIKKEITKSQANLSGKDRRENLEKSFFVVKTVKNKNLVIFDDVFTTGTTLKQITRVLKENQAGLVWGLTLCR